MSDAAREPLLQELQEIKKLLVLQLLALGYKQKHVAATLNLSESTLSYVAEGTSQTFFRKRSN
jgi:DNA-binding NarL/FixJ family response regulator